MQAWQSNKTQSEIDNLIAEIEAEIQEYKAERLEAQGNKVKVAFLNDFIEGANIRLDRWLVAIPASR